MANLRPIKVDLELALPFYLWLSQFHKERTSQQNDEASLLLHRCKKTVNVLLVFWLLNLCTYVSLLIFSDTTTE